VPARRRRAKHQENRSRPRPKARPSLSAAKASLCSFPKQNPAEKSTGFVSGLSRREAAFSFATIAGVQRTLSRNLLTAN
jgi:hypothetical protein